MRSTTPTTGTRKRWGSTGTRRRSKAWCATSCQAAGPSRPRPAVWAEAPPAVARPSLQRAQLEGRHRLQEAAQRERADRLDLGDVADLALDLSVDDDLAGARLRAQARRQVGHVADRGIFPALLEADHAER